MISFRTGLPRVAARLRQQEKENQPRGLLSGIRSKNKKRRRGRGVEEKPREGSICGGRGW